MSGDSVGYSVTDEMTLDETCVNSLAKLLKEAWHFVDRDGALARASLERASALLEQEGERRRRSMTSAAARPGPALAPWQAKRVRAYIEDNLAAPLRISDLATLARLKPGQFSRAFKGSFGSTPHAYLVQRRMAHAQYLLMAIDAPLSQIALICGLSDQPHFTKMFLRETGATPGAWRRQRLGSGETPRALDRIPAPQS